MYPEREYEELIRKIKAKVKEELEKNTKVNVSVLNLKIAEYVRNFELNEVLI